MHTEARPKIKPEMMAHGIRRDGTKVLLHADGPGIRYWFLNKIAKRNLTKWNAERGHLDGSTSN